MENVSDCLRIPRRQQQQQHPTTSFVHGYYYHTPTARFIPTTTTTTTAVTTTSQRYVSSLDAVLTRRRRRCWSTPCSGSGIGSISNSTNNRRLRTTTIVNASVVGDSSTPPVNDTSGTDGSSVVKVEKTDESTNVTINNKESQASAIDAAVDSNNLTVDAGTSTSTTGPGEKRDDKKPQRYYNTFEWRGYNVNYLAEGPMSGKPVLFVHGFGASINHWRKNIPAVLETGRCRVYAIDLLGLGASTKASPDEVQYSIELWTEQVIDFIHYIDRIDYNNNNKNGNDNVPSSSSPDHAVQWTLIGNSIGSLICLNATAELGQAHIRSLILMNCAGGLVSFRYSELNLVQRAIFYMFNALLFNPVVGRYLFESIRKPEKLRNVLQQIYPDRAAITDELLDILSMPAYDEGALEVFLAILNGPPGPEPEPLLQRVQWCPTLVLWGEKDPWTPLDTGYHRGSEFPRFHEGLVLKTVPGAGHCIHDEVPNIVNALFVPFVEEPKFKGDE